MQEFNGFPKEGLDFLSQLKKNNNKEWFNVHKVEYKRNLEEPAKTFFSTIAQEFSTMLGTDKMGGKIFRIYRDVRFSKDKTPYNPELKMAFGCEDDAMKTCLSPKFFFKLDAKELVLVTGVYEMEKDNLEDYRKALIDELKGREIVEILQKLEGKGIRLSDPHYKRVPRGYDPEHPRAYLLRCKGFCVWYDLPVPTEMFTKKAVSFCMKKYQELYPVYAWFNTILP